MCLKVFVDGNQEQYSKLKSRAAALGSAYQKVNFLRDYAADTKQLGRYYFPNNNGNLNKHSKAEIIEDIRKDFLLAATAVDRLPKQARAAVKLSYVYYSKLLDMLAEASVETITSGRLRINNLEKLRLYGLAKVGLL